MTVSNGQALVGAHREAAATTHTCRAWSTAAGLKLAGRAAWSPRSSAPAAPPPALVPVG